MRREEPPNRAPQRPLRAVPLVDDHVAEGWIIAWIGADHLLELAAQHGLHGLGGLPLDDHAAHRLRHLRAVGQHHRSVRSRLIRSPGVDEQPHALADLRRDAARSRGMLWRLPRTFETTPVRCASCSAVRPTMPGSAPSTMYCWPAVNSVRNRASNFSQSSLTPGCCSMTQAGMCEIQVERSDAALILRPLLRLRDAGLAVLGVVVGVQPVLRHEDQVTLVIGDAFEAEGVALHARIRRRGRRPRGCRGGEGTACGPSGPPETASSTRSGRPARGSGSSQSCTCPTPQCLSVLAALRMPELIRCVRTAGRRRSM